MGNQVTPSNLSMTDLGALAAIDYPNEYDFADIGMESACPALQALRWHEPPHHAVHFQGAL
jgi:hypothetical protein